MLGSTNSLFMQLAIVLGLATIFGYIVRLFKLPLLISYLLVGVAISLFALFDPKTSQALTFLPEIGIAFVLFFVGMELDLAEIKSLGKPILTSGLIQILITLLAGFLISQFLGFGNIESFYLGAGLAFSSTIVVVKFLLEKDELSSLYGRLSLGITLLEDLAAVIILMTMGLSGNLHGLGHWQNLEFLSLIARGLILIAVSLLLSRYALTSLFKMVASSGELLFLTALAWCFIFVSLSLSLGFSVVIGAFLAGVALANSPFHFEIQGKVKPLRDFFVMLFFVYLGSKVSFSAIPSIWVVILIFTTYAVLVKPLIYALSLGMFGFRRHTIFHTALSLSQISEFSLIILVIGMSGGLVSAQALTVMALTGVISIIISSVMISNSRIIYRNSKKLFSFFERTEYIHQSENQPDALLPIENHVVLVGGHRVGGKVIRFLKSAKIPFLVLDLNPKIISSLISDKIHALYGDIGDPEILEFLNLASAKLVISTATNLDDNLMLLSELKRKNAEATVITRASSVSEAEKLYRMGSDYVILPETITGDFLTNILKSHWPSLDFFKNRKNRVQSET